MQNGFRHARLLVEGTSLHWAELGGDGAATSATPVVLLHGLMEQMHRCLAGGRSMPDALHAARAGLDTGDPRQFVNWCSFTAYGAG